MPIEDLFALIDCIPTPVFVMDVKEGNIPVYAHYNRSALKRLERPMSDFIGRTAIETFGPEFGETAFREQCKSIESRAQRRYEFRLPIDGELRIVRTTLAPQVDAQGNVIRLIGHTLDVSAEQAADRAQAKLAQIGNEVEQFISMAAHDLRTPMRNVRALAELLREDFIDQGDGKLQLIDMLAEISDKAMTLITDVLSHATAVGQVGAYRLYDFGELVSDIMSVLDPRHQHNMTCPELMLDGEKTAMQIILHNLIDNAIKHGARESLSLTCTVTQIDDNLIEVTLTDDGAGFENPGRVFLDTGEFRVDSGYGLFGIRRLITSRGGNISAANNDRTGGSTVRFTLTSTVLSKEESRRTLRHAPSSGRQMAIFERKAS